jgi:gamma-glutamyltranspeptidase/glutathione hydrolase
VDWRLPYPSIRQPILAANCVATSQPLAAQAGLAMLAKGGNAVDAAIATAVALTVVEPVTNGIGSDAFAIVASGGALVGLNASGRSPAGWTEARFADQRSMPATGWDSVTVPGAVSAWVTLHKRFGRLPFQTLLEPAIGHAR